MATGTEERVLRQGPDRMPGITLLMVAAFVLLVAGMPWAADAPVVIVYPDRIVPERLQVHQGELVTWRASGGGALRLELDPHPSAHERVVRAGRIAAYFRQPGDHWYLVSLEKGGRQLRGIVTVSDKTEREPLTTCGPESSSRICFEP